MRESEPLTMDVCAEDLRFGPLNYDPPASKPSAVASRSAGRLVQAEKFHATRVNVANYNRSAHYLIKTVSASPSSACDVRAVTSVKIDSLCPPHRPVRERYTR